LLYNSILKPIWTYGSQLWGNASNSNIDIIQRAQSKILIIVRLKLEATVTLDRRLKQRMSIDTSCEPP